MLWAQCGVFECDHCAAPQAEYYISCCVVGSLVAGGQHTALARHATTNKCLVREGVTSNATTTAWSREAGDYSTSCHAEGVFYALAMLLLHPATPSPCVPVACPVNGAELGWLAVGSAAGAAVAVGAG